MLTPVQCRSRTPVVRTSSLAKRSNSSPICSPVGRHQQEATEVDRALRASGLTGNYFALVPTPQGAISLPPSSSGRRGRDGRGQQRHPRRGAACGALCFRLPWERLEQEPRWEKLPRCHWTGSIQCSTKRRRATRRAWGESRISQRYPSPKNTDGPRTRRVSGAAAPQEGRPSRENEAVANAKDGGLKEFRSQYARARRVSQALRLRSAHDRRALPTVHSAGPVWRFIGTVRRRKAGGTIRRIVCRRGGRGTSRLW